jgi:hypothetical protein
MRGSLLTYVVVEAVFVVVAFAPHNMQIAIVCLAQQSLLLIDRFCTMSPSGDGSKNILQEKGEQIWQQSERGDAADFLKPGVCKGGIEHLCLATTLGKAKDDDGAVCNLVALLFVWSLQGVTDLFVPPALELPLRKSMALCHGRCVQEVTESSRACA